MTVSELTELRDAMREFTEERGWERYHDPKSLALALVGEVGELAELLQWLPADAQMERVSAPSLSTRLGEEMADVLLYLVRLADVAGIELGEAARTKMQANREKHPEGTSFG